MPLGTDVSLELGQVHIVLDSNPGPLTVRGTSASNHPMSVLAKRSPISATAELLSKYFHRQKEPTGDIFIPHQRAILLVF